MPDTPAMTQERLREIEGRLHHVTPGPGVIFQGEDPDNPDDYDGPYPKWRGVAATGEGGSIVVEKCGGDDYVDSILNADFIANAKEDVPALIAALRSSWEENTSLKRTVARLESELRDVATFREYAKQIREQAESGPIMEFFQRGDRHA